MAKDAVTNKTLYTEILKVHEKIDGVVESLDQRIKPLEVWRATIMGQLAIVGGITVVIVSFVTDWVKEKFFKI